MKLITVIGARPQFIKAAPFSDVFRKNNIEIIIHTGQHYDINMSDLFFEELHFPKPDYTLNIGSYSHGKQTAKMLDQIEAIIQSEKPDGLLVYGDTNSTLAGALAASKLHVPVYHVEAGLRSYNKLMPEEQNLLLTDHISDMLFCPTQTAVANLKKEGILQNVYNTGDIMFDSILRNIVRAQNKYSDGYWKKEISSINKCEINIKENEYYLATIHRAENTDDPKRLMEIFKAFAEFDKIVLLPLHPRTKKVIDQLGIRPVNTTIVQPVSYLLMLHLASNAYMVVTDSGGLQKEAYFLKTPCTTIRDQTEWVETLENSWNVLSQTNISEIITKVQRDLSCLRHPQPKFFGEGDAALKICELIVNGGRTK